MSGLILYCLLSIGIVVPFVVNGNNKNSYVSKYESEFEDYVKEYGKIYNNTEYMRRYEIFETNMDYIEQSNKDTRKTYKLGINNFTDISHEEFKKTYLNSKINPTEQHNDKFFNYATFPKHPIPDSIDWRASGIVTEVKNQGQCGSCWAFSAIGVVEGQHAKNTSHLVSLSEQNLVDCANTSYSCEMGGYPNYAMQYIVNNKGVDTEATYPYEGQDGTCDYNKNNSGANISKVFNIQKANMTALHYAIATIGPISVCIDAEYDFQMYSSGIFSSTECSSTALDHAVLAVGYGISAEGIPYIIVKNSWGGDWGMNGYIYFSTEIPNMCGLAELASYSIV
jgi:cathepsin L